MFGPSKGPRRRIGIALTVAAATATFTLASGVVHAQEAPGEAVIGTFETTRAARAADGKPPSFDFGKAGPADQQGDDETSRMFADAMDALDSGDRVGAQRKFEAVVAREPDGHLAKSARNFLAELYLNTQPSRRTSAAAEPSAKFATPPSSLGARDVTVTKAPDDIAAAPDASLDVANGLEEEFIVSTGDRVFFGPGSAELGQRARGVLAAQARWLANRPELTAVIEGHADDGAMPNEQSAKLSQARAAAVRDRLVAEGIPTARLTITGLGRSKPVADCPGSDCAAQNRRVVTVLKTQSREIARRGRIQSLASEASPQPTQ